MAGGRSAVNFELKEFRAREETIDLSGVLWTSSFPLMFNMFDVMPCKTSLWTSPFPLLLTMFDVIVF